MPKRIHLTMKKTRWVNFVWDLAGNELPTITSPRQYRLSLVKAAEREQLQSVIEKSFALMREYVTEVTSQTAPELMTEGSSAGYAAFETGHDPADPVDRSIMATRKAVFPLHGEDVTVPL